MRKLLLAVLALLIFTNVLNSQNQEFDSFWNNFKSALSEGSEQKIINMTYFATDEEKEYFSFSLIFDNEAIITITQSTDTSFTIFKDKEAEFDENPFEILALPDEIKELYLLKVNYEDDTADEPYTYQRVYAFGKFEGNYLFLGFYSIG